TQVDRPGPSDDWVTEHSYSTNAGAGDQALNPLFFHERPRKTVVRLGTETVQATMLSYAGTFTRMSRLAAVGNAWNDPGNQSYAYDYNGYGWLSLNQTPLGSTTLFGDFDGGGSLVVTQSLVNGQSRAITMNVFGNQVLDRLSESNQVLQSRTSVSVDGLGRILRDDFHDDTHQTYGNFAHIHFPEQITGIDGSSISRIYTSVGSLEQEDDASTGIRSVFKRDVLGNPVAEFYSDISGNGPVSMGITRTYDVRSRPTEVVTPLGTYTYSYNGFSTTISNPDGGTRKYIRNPDYSIREITGTGLPTHQTFDYSVQGGGLSVLNTYAGNANEFDRANYNLLGLNTTVERNAAGTTTFEYNSRNQVRAVIDPADVRMEMGYANTRLKTHEYPNMGSSRHRREHRAVGATGVSRTLKLATADGNPVLSSGCDWHWCLG
ncbi:MAG: hypothetical protein AAF492_24920, partial [Verrucomicrobiota bacterium]